MQWQRANRGGPAGSRARISSILSVAYRLAPVAPDAIGRAEQVLAAIDRELVSAGHRSVVLACNGSRVAGELVRVDVGDAPLSEAQWARAEQLFSEQLEHLLRERTFDVVHFHGLDVGAYPLDAAWLRDVPKLVTLHVPRHAYPPALLQTRGNISFNTVSDWQRQRLGAAATIRASIPNGVDLTAWHPEARPHGGYVACLGHIRPEKGFDVALRAARAADLPLLLAGHTGGDREHERHFQRDIVPLLDARRRFVGCLRGERKRRLLAHASAVVVSSQVAEACSLVTLEALACGTPVIVPRAGAPATLIEDGSTGWIADGEVEIAAALELLSELDRAACRRRAECFDERDMVRQYLALYAELARPAAREASRAASAPLVSSGFGAHTSADPSSERDGYARAGA